MKIGKETIRLLVGSVLVVGLVEGFLYAWMYSEQKSTSPAACSVVGLRTLQKVENEKDGPIKTWVGDALIRCGERLFVADTQNTSQHDLDEMHLRQQLPPCDEVVMFFPYRRYFGMEDNFTAYKNCPGRPLY
jgi:hypothetical protein